MENGGLVSVIIPVFNVRPYLAEALDSVLRQTYEHLEILLIDDGSADGSGEMCDEYARRDGRIRVIHQANRGLSGARNAGLNAMTGDAVVFLDPDDALRPDYVRKMAEAMVREGAELVLCKYEEHRTDGRMERTGRERAKPLIGEGLYDREEALRALVDERLNKSVWNKLYSRRLWENIRYPDGHVYEDIATTFRILDLCRTVYVLDEPLYLHRIRPGSITGSHLPEKSRDWLFAWSQFDAFIETHTPEIFTPKQLKKSRQARLDRMINSYVHYACEKDEEGKAFSEELQKKIMDTEKEIGRENCGCKTRMACRVIISCPGLVKTFYPVYAPFRRIGWLLMRAWKRRK